MVWWKDSNQVDGATRALNAGEKSHRVSEASEGQVYSSHEYCTGANHCPAIIGKEPGTSREGMIVIWGAQ